MMCWWVSHGSKQERFTKRFHQKHDQNTTSVYISAFRQCPWWCTLSTRPSNKHAQASPASWSNATLSKTPLWEWFIDLGSRFTFQLLHRERSPKVPVFTAGPERRERSRQWVCSEHSFAILCPKHSSFYYFVCACVKCVCKVFCGSSFRRTRNCFSNGQFSKNLFKMAHAEILQRDVKPENAAPLY